MGLQENSYAKHLHATLPDAQGDSSIDPAQSSDRGVAIEEFAQLHQHLLLLKRPGRKPRRRDQGKPPMMHAYIKGCGEQETSPEHVICEVFQQKIWHGSVISTTFTSFCSQHSHIRELRKKGGLGTRTSTCCLALFDCPQEFDLFVLVCAQCARSWSAQVSSPSRAQRRTPSSLSAPVEAMMLRSLESQVLMLTNYEA
jgi:hypothetical protein